VWVVISRGLGARTNSHIRDKPASGVDGGAEGAGEDNPWGEGLSGLTKPANTLQHPADYAAAAAVAPNPPAQDKD